MGLLVQKIKGKHPGGDVANLGAPTANPPELVAPAAPAS
jgi:hypothetical protein